MALIQISEVLLIYPNLPRYVYWTMDQLWCNFPIPLLHCPQKPWSQISVILRFLAKPSWLGCLFNRGKDYTGNPKCWWNDSDPHAHIPGFDQGTLQDNTCRLWLGCPPKKIEAFGSIPRVECFPFSGNHVWLWHCSSLYHLPSIGFCFSIDVGPSIIISYVTQTVTQTKQLPKRTWIKWWWPSKLRTLGTLCKPISFIHGYGSIPTNTIFRGYKVLTQCHIYIYYIYIYIYIY